MEFSIFWVYFQNLQADEAFTKAIESYYEVFLKSERVAKVVSQKNFILKIWNPLKIQAGGFSANDFREVKITFLIFQINFYRFFGAMWSVGYGHCPKLTGSAKTPCWHRGWPNSIWSRRRMTMRCSQDRPGNIDWIDWFVSINIDGLNRFTSGIAFGIRQLRTQYRAKSNCSTCSNKFWTSKSLNTKSYSMP